TQIKTSPGPGTGSGTSCSQSPGSARALTRALTCWSGYRRTHRPSNAAPRARMVRRSAVFETTIAGSLPKPSWLAEPIRLWAPWRLSGSELEAAKLDATLLAVKEQEDAGIDVVTDREQSRQPFVHGFLEPVEG